MNKAKEKNWISSNIFYKKYKIAHKAIVKLIKQGYIERDKDYKIVYGLHRNVNLISINSVDKILGIIQEHCRGDYRRDISK